MGGCAKKGSTDIFRFENHQVSVEVGDAKQLLVTGNFEKGDEINYELVGSDEEIISFTVVGEDRISVLALKPGNVTIRASIAERNVAATIIVQVILPKTSAIKIIAPDNIDPPTPEKPRYQIKLNTSVSFTYVLIPETDVNNTVIWSVEDINNKKIVSDQVIINKNGVFTSIVGGDMFIVATSLDGNTKAKLAIHVEYTPITNLVVEVEENNSNAALTNITNAYLRESIKLKANVTPSTSNPNVVWTSSNPNVTVDPKTGLAYCNSVGTGTVSATITATSVANNTIRGSITLNFSYAPAESINLLSADLIAITAGQPLSLNAEISPANANPNLTWTIIKQELVPVFDIVTKKEIANLASLTQTANIANVKTVYQGEVVARVASTTNPAVFKDVVIKITERPVPTKISVVSDLAALKQTVKFFDDSQIRTVTNNQTLEKHLAFGKEIIIVAKVIPFEAHQDLIFTIADPSVAIITSISAPSITGETQIKLIPLKPGNTDIFIFHKYATAYSDLESVILSLTITEQSLTLDKTTEAEIVQIDSVPFAYYYQGSLTNFEFEFENAFGVTNYTWRVVNGEGAVNDGVKIHTVFGDFIDTFFYVANTGTYYFEAVNSKTNNVFFTTQIVVN